MELVPDSRDVCSGAVQEGESVADTSDWYSGWSRNPPNRWCEAEKSNLMHDMCGAGEQDEREQQEGYGQHCTTGGEPLLGWKHEVRVKGAQGVKEVGRQLRVPCDEPRFEENRVER